MNQTFLDKSSDLIKLSKLPNCAIQFLNHFEPLEFKELKMLDLASMGFLTVDIKNDKISCYFLKYYVVLSDGMVLVPYSRVVNNEAISDGISVLNFIRETGAKDKMIGLIQIFKNSDGGNITTIRATVMLNSDIDISLVAK